MLTHIAGGSTPTPDHPPAPVAPVLNGDHKEAQSNGFR